MLCAVPAAGCGSGGSSHSSSGSGTGAGSASAAEHVCAQARLAAASTLGHAVTVKVASSDPINLGCRVRSGRTRLDVVAQASPQAWTEFNTTQAHQEQVYGPGVHEPGQIPRNMSRGNTLVEWIPAKNQLFGTSGSPTKGGSYLTVTVTHGPRTDAARARLAQAVGLATLAVAPRGANPGQP